MEKEKYVTEKGCLISLLERAIGRIRDDKLDEAVKLVEQVGERIEDVLYDEWLEHGDE